MPPEIATPERWQRVREVFAAALELPAAERDTFVAASTGDDLELAAEIEALLAAHGRAEGFLEGEAEAPAADPLEGARIGTYLVLHRLGIGGMGAVYLAQRADEEFHKRVALKVLKPGMDSEEVIRRFRTERQILAALDHPNIAKLLDGGTTDRGLPYFVMEHVEGKPIDRFCDEHRLSIPARLELFRRVCAAVQFAHQNLVIHRDLKPGNILVMEDGTPKLLDFGIAKLLNPELSGRAAVPTALALQPMTPDYASPEQVRGEHITTASDVYALGVLLYELLTSRHPYRERASSAEEMRRLITEVEPERPSTAVARTAGSRSDASPEAEAPAPEPATRGTADARSAGRGLDSARLRRRLAGDLDNIVLMALRKQPARRYASVEQLSEDVRRHLEGLPVAARRGTVAYRMEKFVRRHRLGVAVAATLLLAVLAFSVAMATLAARLAEERDRAEQEKARAEQVTKFLVDLFQVSDPEQARGGTPTAREMLDRGAQRLSVELPSQPMVRAELLSTVGHIYRQLGLVARAETLLREAMRLREETVGAADPTLAEAQNELALVLKAKGEYAAARSLFEQALTSRRARLGAAHPAVAQTLSDLGVLYLTTGDLEQAEATLTAALEVGRQLQPAEPAEVARVLTNLGILSTAQGRYAEAESLFREALELCRRAFGDEHAKVAGTLGNLAMICEAKGDLRQAETFARQALELRRRLFPGDTPGLADTITNLGVLQQMLGAPAEAEALHREALAMRRRLFTGDQPQVAVILRNLGDAVASQGDLVAALPLYREALAMQRRLFGEEHTEVADGKNRLGAALRDAGDLGAAEPLLADALAVRRKLLGDEHPDVAESLVELARLDTAKHQGAAGEAVAREALAILERAETPVAWRIAEARVSLADCLIAERRYGEAEVLLVASVVTLEAQLGERAPATRGALRDLAALYESWGKRARAAELRARLAQRTDP